MPRCAAIAALALALLLGSGPAAAYCRSAVCAARESRKSKVCEPPEEDDCGVVLQWRQPCIGFAVQADASSQIDYDTAKATLRNAFAAWTSVDCGNGSPAIEVFDLGSVACNAIEYNQHDGNANTLIFRDTLWPHENTGLGGTSDAIALTTVTYDVDNGDIYDADIEVNTANNRFTTGDTSVEVDFLSVLTHEAGHFLGMAHSPLADATMKADYDQGSSELRTLSDDDEAGICSAYPPDRQSVGECTALPRHGFSPACVGQQTEGKCAASPGPSPGIPRWTLAAAALVLVAQRTRARARRKIS